MKFFSLVAFAVSLAGVLAMPADEASKANDRFVETVARATRTKNKAPADPFPGTVARANVDAVIAERDPKDVRNGARVKPFTGDIAFTG
ncbi:hypothetical protein Cob_v001452 [Colletotrichum orbiculare MAFF 240422]|uniref:Uncharacterized protein n=1 Tax=Colletotrichum orbiculare (strain 104-T / ATCC 96160 / CBS 514.97 / LARS 414 / MAFF 240422) TaxID=1213857 RepID=N4VAH2_COLOR|nr:hypothetical protein Cob_v001452 [Colletotrichum orbiculare MAFF 240422]